MKKLSALIFLSAFLFSTYPQINFERCGTRNIEETYNPNIENFTPPEGWIQVPIYFHIITKNDGSFNVTDVWFEGVIKWDGANYSVHNNGFPKEPNGDGWRINKIWGSGSNDLYVVGNNGNIAHYNGSQWRRIESGTSLHIYDIWGDFNKEISDYEIYAVCSKVAVNFDKRIIRINKLGEITSLSTNGIPSNLTGIWFKNKSFYVVGSGMFRNIDITGTKGWKPLHYGITNYHLNDIRGNDLNDIVVYGDFGELLHFNGVSWKTFINETYMYGAWGGTIKGNIICCVGLKDNKAIITIGKR